VTVLGSNAYLADGQRLLSIDVSVPSIPVQVGTLNRLSVDVEAAGDYVYMVDGSMFFTVVGVTNPSSPSIVRTVTMPPGYHGYLTVPKRLAVDGDHAYVSVQLAFTDDFEGLVVIDISDPPTSRRVGELDAGRYLGPVAAAGSGVYFTPSDFSAHTYELYAMDVSTPTAPVLLAGVQSAAGEANGLAARGDLVFVAGGGGSGVPRSSMSRTRYLRSWAGPETAVRAASHFPATTPMSEDKRSGCMTFPIRSRPPRSPSFTEKAGKWRWPGRSPF
jgi:hypothetical protein